MRNPPVGSAGLWKRLWGLKSEWTSSQIKVRSKADTLPKCLRGRNVSLKSQHHTGQTPAPKGSLYMRSRNRNSWIFHCNLFFLFWHWGKTPTFSKWKVWILANIKTNLLSIIFVPSPANSETGWKAWKPNSSTAFQILASTCPYLVLSLMKLVLF